MTCTKSQGLGGPLPQAARSWGNPMAWLRRAVLQQFRWVAELGSGERGEKREGHKQKHCPLLVLGSLEP